MTKKTERKIGQGEIHLHPRVNTQGFDKNPQNINRKGRPPSIRRQLKEMLESDGKLTFPKKDVIRINKGGSVVVKVPTEFMMAQQLTKWAMSKKGADSLKALQMIMEQIDGKPTQTIEGNTSHTHSLAGLLTLDDDK